MRHLRTARHVRAPLAAALAAVLAVAVVAVVVWDPRGGTTGGPGSGGAATPAAGGDLVAGSPLVLPPRSATLPAATDGVALESRLAGALIQHVVVVDRLARAGLRGDTDLAQVADAALAGQDASVRGVVEPLAGARVATSVASAQGAVASAVFSYARALRSGQGPSAQAAKTGVAEKVGDFGRVLSLTAGPAVRTADFDRHRDTLIAQVDAYAREDYPRAYALERSGIEGMSRLAATLGPALAARWRLPPAAPGAARPVAGTSIATLLAVHATFMADTMRSGLAGRPDFPAVTDALDGSSTDLVSSVGTLLGAEPARRFATLWADRVDALVSYAGAAGSRDVPARRASLVRVAAADAAVASFLAAQSRGALNASDLQRGLDAQAVDLVRQVDASSAGDLVAAEHSASGESVVALGGRLGAAFEGVARSRLPQGGAQTGLGGAAGTMTGTGGG